MTRQLASTLSIVSTAAAALAFAAIAAGPAYADDITIDSTPFVSMRTRAEVQSEVRAQAGALSAAGNEWTTQLNAAVLPPSALTRAEARQEYIASRREVNAFNAEDSGSMYLASLHRRHGGIVVAGAAR